MKKSGHRWFEVFDCIVTGEAVAQGKPHPSIFLHAASQFKNVSDNDCVMVVEDSPSGVLAGLRAGMQVFWMPDPGLQLSLDAEMREAGDRLRVIHSLSEILQHVP